MLRGFLSNEGDSTSLRRTRRLKKKKRGDLALDINLNILYADLQCSEYN